MIDTPFEVRVLGPLSIRLNGETMLVSGRSQRALLGALALGMGSTLSIDQLIAAVWGEAHIGDSSRALQVYISRLRSKIDPDRIGLIVTEPSGYRLNSELTELDITSHGQLLDKARAAATARDPRGAAHAFRNALGLWRGPFLGELGSEPYFLPRGVHEEQNRLAALIGAIGVEIALDMAAEVLPELEGLLHEHPLDEQLRSHHMRALYLLGRHGEAVQSANDHAEALREIGLSPGHALRQLEVLILQHDPSLSPVSTGFTDTIPNHVPRPYVVFGQSRIALMPPRTTIGRQPDRDLVIPVPDVSRRHAEISLDADGFVLSDSSSTNGTTLNGLPVDEPVMLCDGDEIGIGATTLRFENR